jgi:hypothetical protein
LIKINAENKTPQKNPVIIIIKTIMPGLKKFGGDLLSHLASQVVPSALKSLTSVFGMGTGVASSPLPPKNECQ